MIKTLSLRLTVAIVAFSASNALSQSYTSTTNESTGAWNTARWNNSVDGPTYTETYTENNNVLFTSGSYSFAGMGATINIGNISLSENVNVTFTVNANTLATAGNVRTVTTATGSVLNLGSQGISTAIGTGFIKEGAGVLATLGGGYRGGFTLNAGTILLRGINAMGNGTNQVVTLNNGTVAANGSLDIPTGRYGGGFNIAGNVQLGALSSEVALSSSSADISFGDVANLNGGTRTLTIGANGAYSFTNSVQNGGLTIEALGGTTGRITLSGVAANTYSGVTTINGGTLELNKSAGSDAIAGNVIVGAGAKLLISQSNQVNDGATVSLSGGTITRGTGVSEVFGALNVSGSSALDFGSGTAGNLAFGTYEENTTPSAVLAINNFLPGNSFTFNNALFAADGSNIGSYFSFGAGYINSSIADHGTNTFTITAIPEPSTYLAAAGLLSLMLWPSRKRLLKDTKKILGLTPPMRDRLAARRAQKTRLEA